MASTTIKPEPGMNQRLPTIPAETAPPIPAAGDPTPNPKPAPAPNPSDTAAAADDDDDEDLFENVSLIFLGLAAFYGIYSILNTFITYLCTFSTFSRLFIALAIFTAALHFVPMIFNDEGEDDSLLPPVWRKARKVLPGVEAVREYVGRSWPMTMVSAGNVNGGLCAAAVYATVWHVRGWEWEGLTAGCVAFWVVLAQALAREIDSSGGSGE